MLPTTSLKKHMRGSQAASVEGVMQGLMKKAIPALFFMTAMTVCDASETRPNVIIIYGDDVGYNDVGAYGCKLIPTPNLDRLATEGRRFTDGHCAAATCTPSRYSLLTGSMGFRKRGIQILQGDAKMAIDPDQFTLADIFKQAGYATGVIGKWHLGFGDGKGPIDWNNEVRPGPLELGFDESFLLPSTNDRVPSVYLDGYRVPNLDPKDPIRISFLGPIPPDVPGTRYPDGRKNPEAMTYYRNTHGHNNSVINGIGRIGYMVGGKSALFKDEEVTDKLMERTRKFIGAHKDKPFFLFYSSQDIHVPRAPHPRFQGKTGLGYRGDAMVALDWVVGEVMAELEKHRIADKTMIIFSSDNGPVYDDGYEDGTVVKTSKEEVDQGHDASGPYRGGKYQIYEGGSRVPFIIRWPAGIKPGVSDALVSQVDLLASFAKWFNVQIPNRMAVDSRDTMGTFLGKNGDGSKILLKETRFHLAIRQQNWKYIESIDKPDQKAQLYNLANDAGEASNLIDQQPEKARELSALLAKYRKQGLAR